MTTYGISYDGGKTWIKKQTTDQLISVNVGTYSNFFKKWTVRGSFPPPTVIAPTPTPTPTPVPTPTPTPTPTPPVLGIVDVINFSTTDSDSTIKKWSDAVQQQADKDISKYWTYTVQMNVIPKSQTPNKGHWYCGFFDDSDVAGALGWHDVGPNGEPLIKCFTRESESFGESPSVTLSHEIAESIGDTNANTTIKGFDENGRACLYFRENADPVEAFTYKINGDVDVSDFVTPAWWVANSSPGTTAYDFLTNVSKPFQILKGGYMEISYDNGQTWQQVDKMSRRRAMHRARTSRYSIYKKPIEERVRSTFKTK